MSIDLEIEVVKPRGDAETLSRLTDKLGTFMTRFYSSGADRVTNVTNGCRLINGTLLYPGEQISVSETISPMTEENGYALAGSYLNGQVVESFGGGICQVSTTLYQAVLRAELQVDERYNHSMVVNYVDHSGDAAIAEGIKDFKFTNNLDNPIYIDGYTTPDKTITFTIYGIETRPENRTLEFESEDLEEIEPGPDRVIADSSMAAGSTKKQSAHIGYRSELYKIVKVDGVETERIKVNSSTYQAVPAILTVGTATADPGVKAILESAIATQDIEYCRAIASGQAPAAAVSEETLAALAQAAEGEGGEQTVENPPD
jgi:vancomycin resistance protein YoaR